MRPLGGRRMGLAELQIIVVGQFFPGTDFAPTFNEDAVVFVGDLAVRRATMVDPAGGIAAPGGIDDDFIGDLKQHGVGGIRVRFGIARVGLLVRDALARVFDQPGAFRYQRECKDTSAVDR